MFAKHPVSSCSAEIARAPGGQEKLLRTVRNLLLARRTPPPHPNHRKHLLNMSLATPLPAEDSEISSKRINGREKD